MTQRNIQSKLISSTLVLSAFILFVFITIPAKSQETEFSVTPLAPNSTFELPKDTSNLPTSLVVTSDDSGRGTGVPLPEAAVAIEKTCDPASLPNGSDISCQITIQNNGRDDLSYRILDFVPLNFELIEDSVVGGNVFHAKFITYRDSLSGSVPPELAIGPSLAPAGYRSLAAEGIPPLVDVGDEAIINFTTPAYRYNGNEYTDVAMASNGYLIAGIGSDAEISPIPQIFPDPEIPNNVLAPFWTDLDPSEGGSLYAALLSLASGESWIVFEWENVPVYSGSERKLDCGGACGPKLYTFQVWLKTGTDVQEISYVYARVDGKGAGTGVNIGAENEDGTLGVNYDESLNAAQAVNGAESVADFAVVPAPGEEFGIVSTPGVPGESHTISYNATAVHAGPWFNCALVKVYQTRGITWSCFDGEVME